MFLKWRFARYIVLGISTVLAQTCAAGVVFNANGLSGGSRWDAAQRTVAGVGERSLAGSLRYSVQGGSYETYRDSFSWSGGVPSVAAFQTAIEQAFSAWTVPDPVSGFSTTLSFTSDFGTPVIGSNFGNGGLDVGGAEIDLFASNDAFFWNLGNPGLQGETRFSAIGSSVTLTSGVANYAGSSAIVGADIILNSNTQAQWNLDIFRRLLAHEIGHAIGLGDVENSINPNRFIDDNFDGSSNATALATLNNSWTHLVDPLNPANSALSVFDVPALPGTSTAGVDILMESNGIGIGPGNPLTNLFPLANDDYGTRQFLYPTITAVPEPSSLGMIVIATLIGGATRYRSRAHRRTSH